MMGGVSIGSEDKESGDVGGWGRDMDIWWDVAFYIDKKSDESWSNTESRIRRLHGNNILLSPYFALWYKIIGKTLNRSSCM